MGRIAQIYLVLLKPTFDMAVAVKELAAKQLKPRNKICKRARSQLLDTVVFKT
jgi:hypothetical protein